MAEPRARDADLTGDLWPPTLPGLGAHGVGPFARCATCGTGTWTSYGVTPLCRVCARRRATLRPVAVGAPKSDDRPGAKATPRETARSPQGGAPGRRGAGETEAPPLAATPGSVFTEPDE